MEGETLLREIVKAFIVDSILEIDELNLNEEEQELFESAVIYAQNNPFIISVGSRMLGINGYNVTVPKEGKDNQLLDMYKSLYEKMTLLQTLKSTDTFWEPRWDCMSFLEIIFKLRGVQFVL